MEDTFICSDCDLTEVEEDGARCPDCKLERRNVEFGHAGSVAYVYEISSQEEDDYYDK